MREDLPWPPPTQLRERPNMSAALASRLPHGLMPKRPSGRAPAAAAQAEEAAVEVLERLPNTFPPAHSPVLTFSRNRPFDRRALRRRHEERWEMQFAREAPADKTLRRNYKARSASRNFRPATLEKRRSERRTVRSILGIGGNGKPMGGALRNESVKIGE